MTRIFAMLALSAASGLAGSDDRPAQAGANAAGEPAFRIRSDFAAPLNADEGWAGKQNENVTVSADQPFRIRFEVEGAAGSSREGRVKLQYRRNEGDWTDIDAHDFPYPLRELELDVMDVEPGAMPQGWRAAVGDATGVAVAEDGDDKVLRAEGNESGLVALYPPPWELNEFSFATVFRLPADSRGAVGLVFGYADAANYWRVLLDAGAGIVRMSRIAGGSETVLEERKAGVIAGEWLEVEIQLEGNELEVNFQDDTLEFAETVGGGIPVSDLGFYVPAGGSVDFREFVIEGEPSSPRISIVAAGAYEDGAPTADLLQGATSEFDPGAGVSLARHAPFRTPSGSHSELEWPLVIRRFADGAVSNETGDTFELRMTGASGEAIGIGPNPVLTLEVPPGHLGGTFVETPGRIGPWQARNGDLYFIMEPAESDNLFMMVKSSDGGRTWLEVDGANRPQTGDLESVDGRQSGPTIHILHQVTESTRYHAFRTSDHPTHPDTWAVTDELATTVTARAQMASLVVRSDGSMVAFHLGDTIGYSIRSPSGDWSDETIIDDGEAAPDLAGPQAVLGGDDTVHLAYYRMDGTLWHRRLFSDGTLTPARQLASGAGTSGDDFGSVLPLIYIPGTDTVVVIYRLADCKLWASRVTGSQPPTTAVQVTDRCVVRHAVDSQQTGADAVADGDTVHVLFIDESDRSLYSTRDAGGWQAATLRVDDILGSWVRGNVYVRPDGEKVYGYVYDAGSLGGAGMNRFGEIVLNAH